MGWLNAIRGLTVSNVLVIALLAIVAVPVYVIWKALNDEKVMNRLMSTYEEIDQSSGCTLRHVKERGGPDLWSVSSGFAFSGIDRWFVSVVVNHRPSDDEMVSYCASLKLIADRMLNSSGNAPGGGGEAPEVQRGSVPGAPTNGSGHNGHMPSPSGPPTPAKEEAK
jgi:hypothetical protein